MKKLSNRRWFSVPLLAGLLLITTACKADRTSPAAVPTNTPQAASSPSGSLDIQAVENLEYKGIYEQAVKLTDGEYVGQPFVEGGASRPTVTLQGVTDGDLNQDGLADAVVLLAENSGGSGVFMFLAAVLNENGDLVNTSTIGLGDRVRIQTVRVADGKIGVTLLTHAPEDPLCCPTLVVEKSYLFDAGQLIPLENE